METLYRKIEENGQIRFEPVEEKENGLPKEWRLTVGRSYYYIDTLAEVKKYTPVDGEITDIDGYNVLPTKEHCEALLSLMKLLTMAYEYNGNEWIKADNKNYYFTVRFNIEEKKYEIFETKFQFPLLFKTNELATEFLNNFIEDIEKAQMLL